MIYDAARFYLEEKRPRSFKLRYDCVRPGTWRSRINKNQVRDYGDGTIIATGVNSDDNKRFCELGDELANYLKSRLDYIFEPKFKRKSPNLWTTLGVFHVDTDFEIRDSLFEAFQGLTNVVTYGQIEINSLYMVKYKRRTLDDMILVSEPLPLYP